MTECGNVTILISPICVLGKSTRATAKKTRQANQGGSDEIEGSSSSSATAAKTKGRKVSEAETDEPTSSTATRSRRRQATVAETPVAGKRPRRGQ